jgi:NAD(P)-dependent dehydrogenase (short-subunit alcohol dehydrogenase family)
MTLSGQTVVILGGSAGIGFETARQAREAGAEIILTARDPQRLEGAARELGAKHSEAFDVTDPGALERFFSDLPGPIDHVMLSGPGPVYAPLSEMNLDDARRELDSHLSATLATALFTRGKVRPLGSLLFISGTGGRRPAVGMTIACTLTAATPAMVRNLALELAPTRVNVVAPGFVDTGLSARLLGGQLDARRAELRDKLPIRRVVEPQDVAALAVHIMSNDALTGGTYDVDGGQQLLGS